MHPVLEEPVAMLSFVMTASCGFTRNEVGTLLVQICSNMFFGSYSVFGFVWFGSLCPSQQLWSCRDDQLT